MKLDQVDLRACVVSIALESQSAISSWEVLLQRDLKFRLIPSFHYQDYLSV